MDASDSPYSPPTLQSSALPAADSRIYSYRRIDTLCTVIVVCMVFLTLGYVGMSACETIGGLMFPTFSDPNADVVSNFELVLALGILGFGLFSIPVYLVAIVSVCMFMVRANANVRVFGATGLKFTPGWTAGYWFIPIMNLFRPLQAMMEIFRASERPTGVSWQSVAVPGTFAAWWTTWILGSIVARIETRLAWDGVDLGLMAIPLTWSSTILIGTAAMMLALIVRGINQRQNEWVSHASSQHAPVDPMRQPYSAM